jgi:hypothetical protein
MYDTDGPWAQRIGEWKSGQHTNFIKMQSHP